MLRLVPVLAFFLFMTCAGCSQKPDPVLAAFWNSEFTTNRIVFYSTGRCEHYGSVKDGNLAKHPVRTGTFLGSSSNYVVTFSQGNLRGPSYPPAPKISRMDELANLFRPSKPVRKVYRIIKHDGVEYLFEEGSLAVKNYEESKDPGELRHASVLGGMTETQFERWLAGWKRFLDR